MVGVQFHFERRRWPRKLFRSLDQARFDRILPNVSVVVFVVLCVANAVIYETGLLYVKAKCVSRFARYEKPPLINGGAFSSGTSAAGLSSRWK